MSTTETPKAIWPTKPCTRCGGTGEFSYNPMNGTTCFGCGVQSGVPGTGVMFTNGKVAAIVAEYRKRLNGQKETQPADLAAGMQVYVERNEDGKPQSQQRKTGHGEWLTIYEVTADPIVRRRSSRSGHKIEGDARREIRADKVMVNDMTVAWMTVPKSIVVTYEDGNVESMTQGRFVRTYVNPVDPSPYMIRCADALGKTSRAKARAAYEALVTEAGWGLFSQAVAA